MVTLVTMWRLMAKTKKKPENPKPCGQGNVCSDTGQMMGLNERREG